MTTKSTGKSVNEWQRIVDEELKGDWVKFMKYKLAAFFSFHTNCTLPVKPFESDDKASKLLGGGAGRWLADFLHLADPISKMSLLASIKNAKKGMPRPSKKTVEASVIDTYKLLTTPPVFHHPTTVNNRWEDPADYPEGINTTLSEFTAKLEIRRTVFELFRTAKGKNRPITVLEKMKAFFPSTSANIMSKKVEGGSVKWLWENVLIKDLKSPNGCVTYREVPYQKGSMWEEEDQLEQPNQAGGVIVDTHDLVERFQVLWKRLLDSALGGDAELEARWFQNEERLAEVYGNKDNYLLRNTEKDRERRTVALVGLQEALKVRVISKMPPAQQFVMRGIWKAVWTRLRNHQTFRLIGEPVTESILTEVLGNNLKETEIFLSGDYKAATDNLKSWATETAAQAIAECLELTEEETQVYIESLTKLWIENPDKNSSEEGKEQENGQLMGSVTSFPILCILNAAMARWAIELTERERRKLTQCRLLINGDDILIKSFHPIYQFWQRTTQLIGFQESIGKTFVSREFCDINSTNFLYGFPHPVEMPHRDGGVRLGETNYLKTPFINIGLMKGMKRSAKLGLSDIVGSEATLGSRAREISNSAPHQLRDIAIDFFIESNKEVLKKSRLPWHMPEWLGGLGIPETKKHRRTDLDRRLGRKILMNWRQERPIAPKEAAQWQMRTLAESKLPEVQYSHVKGTGNQAYETLASLMTVNLIFDSKVSFDQVYSGETGQRQATRALKHNSRLWQTAPGKLPNPMTDEELEYKGLYPFTNVCLTGEYLDERTEPKWLYANEPELASATEKVGTQLKRWRVEEQIALGIYQAAHHAALLASLE